MSNIIRRRALMGTRNGEAHECMVEYEGYPLTKTDMSGYFGPACITGVNWPSGVTTIGSYMFCRADFSNTTFSLPETLEKICQRAFNYANGITNISIPSSLELIFDYAFSYSSLTSITFPSNFDCFLATTAFGYCSGLTTINIPDSVALNMESYVFAGTAWLTNQPNNSSVYLGKNYYQFKGTMPSNTNLVLEEGTLSIAGYAFNSRTQLKSITIPNTVKYIGYNAFYGCTGLTSITIPESLSDDRTPLCSESINSETNRKYTKSGSVKTFTPFYNNTGITTINWNARNYRPTGNGTASYNFLASNQLKNVTTVNIGSSVETIPSYFINGFSKVTSLTLPNSVTCIGAYAFYGCTGLTSITIPESVTTLGYLSKENTSIGSWSILSSSGITTLNYNAIAAHKYSNNNRSSNLWGKDLTTINIGNQVQVIPAGFLGSNQTSITSINIPSSVTTIEDYAFYQSKLTSIDLPASVTSIGNYAFNGCSSLTSITIRATTPPTLDSSYYYTFPTTSQNYKIYVPASAVDTYKTTSKWSYWSSKIQAIPS